MKNTGVIRRMDGLGRIVFPIELRKKFEMFEGVQMEIYTEGDTIILKKYEPACIFCGEAKDVRDYMGKKICRGCLKAMRIMR